MKARLLAAGTGALLAGWGLAALDGCGNDDPANDGGGADASSDASVAPHADSGTTTASDAAAAAEGEAMVTSGDAALDGAADAGGPLVAYVGGYDGVITRYAVDESRGTLSDAAVTTSFGTSPSFLAVTSDATLLYAVDESAPGKVGAYSIASTGALTFLASVSSGGDGPAYVGLDRSNAYVFVANYTSGTTLVLPIGKDGTLGAPTDSRSPGKNAHMMIADPSNRFVFVPCLGSDYVAQYVFDATSGTLMPNAKAPTFATAAKAGPRHLAFHPNGKNVYLIDETGSTLQALTLDASDGTLTSIQSTSSLGAANDGADASASTAAEVWVHSERPVARRVEPRRRFAGGLRARPDHRDDDLHRPRQERWRDAARLRLFACRHVPLCGQPERRKCRPFRLLFDHRRPLAAGRARGRCDQVDHAELRRIRAVARPIEAAVHTLRW